MRRAPAPNDYDGWVSQLGVSSSRQRAKAHLVTAGPPALPALRRGLVHRKAIVRQLCVRLFDQLVDEASLPDLVLALEDEDLGVRTRAMHALACDRCKQDACRPAEDVWVPMALDWLNDPDPDLRASAIDALGKVAGHRPEVGEALAAASERDPDQGLRSMARRRARV
jgi:HEAT repeat protein